MAALLSLAACSSAPATSVRTARAQFSEENYCPLQRVEARMVETAKPSPEVAADPERLALWNQESARRAGRQLEWRVRVEGCGHESDFVCGDDAATWTPRSQCVESSSKSTASTRSASLQ